MTVTIEIDRTLPKVIRDELAYAERTRSRALALVDVARDVEALGAGTAHCDVERIDLHVDDVDAALRHFAALGYVLRGSRDSVIAGDSAGLYWRLVRRGDDRPRLRIVKMIAPDSKEACRLVQVGTKTVEQPVYEIRCASPEGVLAAYSDAIRAAEGEGGAR